MGAACAASAAGDETDRLHSCSPLHGRLLPGAATQGAFAGALAQLLRVRGAQGRIRFEFGVYYAETPKPKPRSYIASSKPVKVKQKSNSPIKFCCTTHTNQAVRVVTLPAGAGRRGLWSVVSHNTSVKPFHDATTLTSIHSFHVLHEQVSGQLDLGKNS